MTVTKGEASNNSAGLVPAMGEPTGKFLKDDGTWDTPPGKLPVGSVFISVVATNPATLLGYGTWSAFGAGKVMVGLDSNDTSFDTVEETGGSKTHTLATNEIPAHTHIQNSHTHPSIQVQGGTSANNAGTHIMTSVATAGSSRAATSPESANAATATNQNTGGGEAHNNLQPYIVCYFWKRTL